MDSQYEFLPNQTFLLVPITIVDDVFPEEAEQFEVILTASPGVFIDSPASTTVTILNDDPDLPGKYTNCLGHPHFLCGGRLIQSCTTICSDEC